MAPIKIGKSISPQRKVHKLTQSEISEKVGITENTISNEKEKSVCRMQD